MTRVDRRGDVGLECPDGRLVAVRGEKVGERRSPRAGADDGGAHQPNLAAMRIAAAITIAMATNGPGRFVALSFFPNRCSSPFRSRSMFARCVQKTNTATSTLI